MSFDVGDFPLEENRGYIFHLNINFHKEWGHFYEVSLFHVISFSSIFAAVFFGLSLDSSLKN